MKLLVDNQLVTLAELRRVWLDHVTVELGHSAQRRIAESNELIDDVVAHGDHRVERQRHRECEAVVVVGVFADQVHPPGCPGDEAGDAPAGLVRSACSVDGGEVGVGHPIDPRDRGVGSAPCRVRPRVLEVACGPWTYALV